MNVSNAVHNLTMINHLNFVMKTVETGKNLPSNVMMETTLILTGAVLLVSLKIAGFVTKAIDRFGIEGGHLHHL